jgi:hypothetical protein
MRCRYIIVVKYERTKRRDIVWLDGEGQGRKVEGIKIIRTRSRK